SKDIFSDVTDAHVLCNDLRDLAKHLPEGQKKFLLGIVHGPLRDLIIERNKAVRICRGNWRHERIKRMRCETCNHKRKFHRREHNQMYQWFSGCEKYGCSCKRWEHKDGDPYL
ncbi:MAG: hypothetical protein ACXACY_28685, partial [Candidatus Hodarchaeales archaeon]